MDKFLKFIQELKEFLDDQDISEDSFAEAFSVFEDGEFSYKVQITKDLTSEIESMEIGEWRGKGEAKLLFEKIKIKNNQKN